MKLWRHLLGFVGLEVFFHIIYLVLLFVKRETFIWWQGQAILVLFFIAVEIGILIANPDYE